MVTKWTNDLPVLVSSCDSVSFNEYATKIVGHRRMILVSQGEFQLIHVMTNVKGEALAPDWIQVVVDTRRLSCGREAGG